VLNIGPLKLVVILAVALLVFGPEKLPEIARQVGRALQEFRKFQASLHANVRDVIEPITGPIIPNGPLPPAPAQDHREQPQPAPPPDDPH
jgi:sec-independent protein translocase protein TatA